MNTANNPKNQKSKAEDGSTVQISIKTLLENVNEWLIRIAEDIRVTKAGDPIFDYLDGQNNALEMVREWVINQGVEDPEAGYPFRNSREKYQLAPQKSGYVYKLRIEFNDYYYTKDCLDAPYFIPGGSAIRIEATTELDAITTQSVIDRDWL